MLGQCDFGNRHAVGGDVMCASGTGRFIADSWFSDEPLPAAYTDATAAQVRESGGVSSKVPDRDAIRKYIAAVDIPGAIEGVRGCAAQFRRLARAIHLRAGAVF